MHQRNLAYWGLLIPLGLPACSGDHGSPSDAGANEASIPDGPRGDGPSTGGDAAAAGSGEGGADTGSPDAAGPDGSPAGGDAEAGSGAWQVVADLGRVPASLALSGGNLYVTLAENPSPGNDGEVVSIPKTASGATVDGGSIAVLASGLHQPRAVAVSGATVYWADTEASFPGYPNVMSVPLAGGTAKEFVSNVSTDVRLVIANSVLYEVGNNNVSLVRIGLTADGGASSPVFAGFSPNAINGLDSDGTNVFFGGGSNGANLYSVAAAGGGMPNALATGALSGSLAFSYVVDDDTSVYWSDPGTGSVFSVPKTGGSMPKTLATFATGSAPVQLLLDGAYLYTLDAGALRRLPKTGGTPAVLASVSGGGSETFLGSLANAIALAVDDSYVYWLFAGHGQVLRIRK